MISGCRTTGRRGVAGALIAWPGVCGGVEQGVPDRVGGPGRVVTTDSRELRRRLLQARLVV
jgi:hypothetical protein